MARRPSSFPIRSIPTADLLIATVRPASCSCPGARRPSCSAAFPISATSICRRAISFTASAATENTSACWPAGNPYEGGPGNGLSRLGIANPRPLGQQPGLPAVRERELGAVEPKRLLRLPLPAPSSLIPVQQLPIFLTGLDGPLSSAARRRFFAPSAAERSQRHRARHVETEEHLSPVDYRSRQHSGTAELAD